MCNLMHAETNEDGDYRIQSFDDYRKCKYEGPGNDNNYYDLKYDYLVMQAEAGCPYTRRGCSGSDYTDGDCIGDDDPTAGIEASTVDTIYYDRKNAACYYLKAAKNWSKFNLVAVVLQSLIFKISGIVRVIPSCLHSKK